MANFKFSGFETLRESTGPPAGAGSDNESMKMIYALCQVVKRFTTAKTIF